MTYVARLETLTSAGPAVCVGIDPHPEMLAAWGEKDSAAGLDAWSRSVRGVLGQAGVRLWKPQVALFERHGVRGMAILSELLGGLREDGGVVIGDAKRGDIGSTMAGYADAWLKPGADFEVDALTLVAYQGVGALVPALERATENSKGVFVLAATSNPEAWPTQSARRADGLTVAAGVVEDLARWAHHSGSGACGIVVGATVDHGALGLDLSETPGMPILAPGYGRQGAHLSDVHRHFPRSRHVLAVSARAVLEGGRDAAASLYAAALAEVGQR